MSEAFNGYVCTSAAIDAAVAERSMLSHPFYRAWEEGALTRDALAAYARNDTCTGDAGSTNPAPKDAAAAE